MINLIWAMDKNGLIGKCNKMPWHYKEDLQYFKKMTANQDVLMGKNTYLSLKGYYANRPLPYKKIYIASRNFQADDALVINNAEEFFKNFPKTEQLFVCGGSQIYEIALKYADYLYVTRIDKEYDGDTYFPKFDETKFIEISSKQSGELKFCVLKRG